MLGRLSWSAVPFDQPIIMGTCGVIVAALLALSILITAKGWGPYLWREWITSVDHKRIGVMYMILGLVMLVRGFADGIMMRTQRAAETLAWFISSSSHPLKTDDRPRCRSRPRDLRTR
jgi:cytochrome o ubiquinol oxidase subunit 1